MATPRVFVRPTTIGSHQGAWVEASTDGMGEVDYDRLFDETDRALASEGLQLADAVRSRLTAATRAGRSTGSVVRLRRLAIPFPVATSSYIDLKRFAGGDGALLETLAVAGARLRKRAAEHDPSPPPWKVITIGDMAFVTGTTSTVAALHDQLDDIRARLAERLALGAELIGGPIRPVGGAAYVGRGIDLSDLVDLSQRIGIGDLPLVVERCDGFASLESFIEVELDAVMDSEDKPTVR
jgi:hypothetical protein